MPPALQFRPFKTETRSITSMLTGAFILVLGWGISLCVMDIGFGFYWHIVAFMFHLFYNRLKNRVSGINLFGNVSEGYWLSGLPF